MKGYVVVSVVLMMAVSFAGLGTALDPLDGSDKNKDDDRDGLRNWEEYRYGTDPNLRDTDGGGAYDGWEIWYNGHRAVDPYGYTYVHPGYYFDPNDGVDEGVVANKHMLIQVRDWDALTMLNDPDSDNWNNLHEFIVGTDPTNPNTDGDRYHEDSSDPDPLVSNSAYPWPGSSDGGRGQGDGSDEGGRCVGKERERIPMAFGDQSHEPDGPEGHE
jgi:hypothetical protein